MTTKRAVVMALALLSSACGDSLPPVPETLSTAVAMAPRCRKVAYSSNRDDRFRPFLLDLAPGAGGTITPLGSPGEEDLFVRSLSFDCTTLALVSDQGGRGSYDVLLQDVRTGRLTNLTRSPGVDDGHPLFSPTAPLLAFLSGGELVLHDRDAGTSRRPERPGISFKSVYWAPEGDRIYLEDDGSGIWEYSVPGGRFRPVWQARRKSYSPRMGSSRGDRLYFISDHETDVTQVYRLGLRTGSLERIAPSAHDQYSPVEREDGAVLFRTNVDGSFLAAVARDGRTELLPPSRGVVYDFSLDFERPLLLYAGNGVPLSLYEYDPVGGSPLRARVPVGGAEAHPEPRIWRTPEGMPHFLYLPKSEPRGWVVWLHGGPHEQVSPRFNPFFDALVSRGYAVAALNYPGSTGIGNAYELRDVPERDWIDRQAAAVTADLRALREIEPGFDRYALVGVSYGAGLAHVLARKESSRVTALVDFSGMVDGRTEGHLGSTGALPPALFIYGENDGYQRGALREALVNGYARAAETERLVIRGEGHFIRRRGSVARAADAIAAFLDRHADGPAQR